MDWRSHFGPVVCSLYRNVSNFAPPVCRFRKVFTTSSLGFWLQGRGWLNHLGAILFAIHWMCNDFSFKHGSTNPTRSISLLTWKAARGTRKTSSSRFVDSEPWKAHRKISTKKKGCPGGKRTRWWPVRKKPSGFSSQIWVVHTVPHWCFTKLVNGFQFAKFWPSVIIP